METPVNESERGQPVKIWGKLRLRGSAGKICEREIGYGAPGFPMNRRATSSLAKKRNRQDDDDNAERCQGQAIQADFVYVCISIAFIFVQTAIRLDHSDHISRHNMRKHVRSLKNRHER